MTYRGLLLVAALLGAACVDRSLPIGGTANDSSDLGNNGSVDLRGADLRSVDLGRPPVFDLAVVDQAASPPAEVGVPCGDGLCSSMEVCCDQFAMGFACFGAGPMGMCPGGGGYRCDGPEDCSMGRRCYVSSDLASSRCRQNGGMSSFEACHVDGDCAMGATCVDASGQSTGAPPIRVCN